MPNFETIQISVETCIPWRGGPSLTKFVYATQIGTPHACGMRFLTAETALWPPGRPRLHYSRLTLQSCSFILSAYVIGPNDSYDGDRVNMCKGYDE